MSTNIRLGFAVVIAAGLAGCGSGGNSTGCAGTATDAGNAAEAAAPADHPTSEAGLEAPVSLADAGADMAATPLDVAVATDSPLAAPDAVAVVGPDAADAAGGSDALDATKSTDTAAADTASSTPDLAPAALGELSPQQLKAALSSKDFLLIDVHFPNAGSIAGTDARIAYNDIPALVAFIGSNPDTKVVLTCYSGHMSKTAGDALVTLGYRNISELTGGTSAWTAAGNTLVRLDGGM